MWGQVETLIRASPHDVQVLSADLVRRNSALEALGVSSRSVLGAIVGECGALLIVRGWLRILGAGAEGLPGIQRSATLDRELTVSAICAVQRSSPS